MIKDVTAEELMQELEKNTKPKEVKKDVKKTNLLIKIYIVSFVTTFLTYLVAIYFQNRDVQTGAELIMIFLGIAMIFITGGKFFPA